MKTSTNILFLGGAKRVSLGEHLLNWGKQHNHDIRIFSYELSEEAPIIEIAKIIKGLKWGDPGIFEHLEKEIQLNKIDIVIPFVDPATIICASLKNKINNVFFPVSETGVCETFFSKLNTQKWCINNKIPVPEEYSGNNIFPIIAKPDLGSASKGIEVLNNNDELINFNKRADKNSFLIQQFIDASEFTVDGYRSTNFDNINYLVPRIRIEVQGGEAIKSRTQQHPKIDILSREIIQKSGLKGAFTLQFLEDKKTREIFFMEANPRFGGGVLTAIGAGVDVADYLMNDYLGYRKTEILNWENNLLMMRRFKEIYIHANNN